MKLLFNILVVISFSSQFVFASEEGVVCNLWSTMYLNADGKARIDETIVLGHAEDVIERKLKNEYLLYINKHYDFISISIKRPMTDDERKRLESLSVDVNFNKEVVVASASGVLRADQKLDTLDLGSRDYYVSCSYSK